VNMSMRHETTGRRRIFCFVLSALLLSLGLSAEAQQPKKVPRIGMLVSGTASSQKTWLDAFRQGLNTLGYVEGQNIIIERRDPEGRPERYPELAAELARLKVDVIVTGGLTGAGAANKATTTIPIVIAAGGDPVRIGLVSSLARPGGNVTGNTALSPDLSTKALELIKEALPKVSRVAIFWNPEGSASVVAFKETEAAAPSLGLTPLSVEIRRGEDLEPAFDALGRRRAEALLIVQSNVPSANMRRIVELAAKHRLPAMYWEREFVEGGGLMSYGPSFTDLYRRAATYVDKILKGAKPADLPVEQPMKFELVINLKTAKQIGLKIPPNVLARADKVIK
jgi:putative tryptophan/tyrosine transport system substrate-binding protein